MFLPVFFCLKCFNAVDCRVRTDLGTDSEPHPVHCGLNRYRSIFLDRHWSNSTSNSAFAAYLLWHRLIIISSTCWVWSTARWTSADAIIHTTAGLDCQLIITISCRKRGTFHWRLPLPDQVLNRQV